MDPERAHPPSQPPPERDEGGQASLSEGGQAGLSESGQPAAETERSKRAAETERSKRAAETERSKRAAAEAAAAIVADGMRVGLGTGSTVAYLLQALQQRAPAGVRYAATSPRTEQAARSLGLEVVELERLDGRLDVTIDGADQVDPECWLIKGGGAAHTREKILAAAASQFVVIVSAEKLVESLSPPVPLELLHFGISSTLRAIVPTKMRDVAASPDGNLIADYLGEIGDPRELAARLSATPGVVEHGLFEPGMVSEVIVGDGERVRRIAGAKSGS